MGFILFFVVTVFQGLASKDLFNLILIFFCQVLTEKQHEEAARNEYNFDHPDAFDFDLVSKTLLRLKEGKKVEVPIYNFVTHSRETKTVSMMGSW